MNPSAAVAGFIFNTKGELLVCRRANDPAMGTLDLPGGFVDNDETAEQAIIRELTEETGLVLSNVKYLFSLPNDYLYSDLNIPTLDMFFECHVSDHEQLTANDDVSECFFLPLSEINPEDFGLASIRKAMQQMKEQRTRAIKR